MECASDERAGRTTPMMGARKTACVECVVTRAAAAVRFFDLLPFLPIVVCGPVLFLYLQQQQSINQNCTGVLQ